MRFRWAVMLCLGVLVLSGCHGLGNGRMRTLGKETLDESIHTLQNQVDGFAPTQINGTCKLSYRDEEGKWRRMPGFTMKFWLEPPYNLDWVGNAAPGPEGKIFLGANQEAFWLSIKPEINTYWVGRWEDLTDVTALELNPRVVLEALGMIQFAPHETWQLENKKGQDVLTCTNTATGRLIKRLTVTTKTYRLAKIQYYDDWGEMAVVVELERYKALDGKNSVPTGLRVSRYAGGKLDGRVTFTLKQGVLRQFTDRIRARMFQPLKSTDGYDEVVDVTGM